MRRLATNVSGIGSMARMASGTSIASMYANDTSEIPDCTSRYGANARYICTARMSELAREMSCPLCIRS